MAHLEKQHRISVKILSQMYLCTNHLALAEVEAIYSQTVVRQFPYVRRSYDIDTTPFAIQEARHTYDWRKYERRFASVRKRPAVSLKAWSLSVQ